MNASHNDTFPADDDDANDNEMGSLDGTAMAHRQRELLVEGERGYQPTTKRAAMGE